MDFFIFDSLKRKKLRFQPVNLEDVRIYACGPTVYNFAHVGNARMAVACDLLVRVLKTKYKNVRFVSNITDIDDKIIDRANQEKKPVTEITKKFCDHYNKDMNQIGVSKPDEQPMATQYIDEMINLIQILIKNECAYEAKGNILFDVKKYKYYGVLSGRNKDDQLSGNRIGVAEYKKSHQDFILWKPSKKNEPAWDSPWGKGRPGWHIECSAMSKKCLGLPFDIHCGGVDLTFPHHENEIAQTCSLEVNSRPESFCKYWFHNGFVTINGEKMSKSLGNIEIVNNLLSNYSGAAIRLSLLSSQYRQPLDWSSKILEQSEKNITRYRKIYTESFEKLEKNDKGLFFNKFLEPLYDDLNTPKSISILNKMFSNLNKVSSDEERGQITFAIRKSLDVLGINLSQKPAKKNVDKMYIEKLIYEREIARKNKDYEKADLIRVKLKKEMIELEDGNNGTTWRRTSGKI